jgi:hypothetical protein
MDGIMIAERPTHTRTPSKKLKTRAGNDWLTLDGVDKRSSYHRRFVDVALGLVRDLGLADSDLTNSLKLKIRSAALTVCNIEVLQAKLARGEQADLLALTRMQNSLDRKLWGLGIGQRRRQSLTPEDALTEHLTSKRAKL